MVRFMVDLRLARAELPGAGRVYEALKVTAQRSGPGSAAKPPLGRWFGCRKGVPGDFWQFWQNRNHMQPVRLQVYIQPRASKTEVAGMHDGVIKIRIAAPAVENAANRALIDFIAQHLGIAKRCVRVVAGGASRRKLLEIDGVAADVIAATLGPRA
jgi:uncharacterized protein